MGLTSADQVSERSSRLWWLRSSRLPGTGLSTTSFPPVSLSAIFSCSGESSGSRTKMVGVVRRRPIEELLKAWAEIMREAGRVPEDTGAQENLYHQIMRLKEVHYLAVFSLIYVGVEVSIGGMSVP